ncbi:MAG: glycosyltransferase family 2 protein, partial [Chloroflexi bacterium]|nr:glycosyltransferase family 2 protein [Chloroflexota bacterium]
MKLSVLVPAYNEERTIEAIVRKVVTARLLPAVELELLIHDDASTDQTSSILSRLQQEFQNIRVIRRDRNGGKGAGIRTLIREASGDVCLFQDADEEYDPADYATLLERYQQGGWPAVYGYRNLHGQPLIG